MKNTFYVSTRGSKDPVTSSEAMLKGIAQDGGLYVPLEIPKINKFDEEFLCRSYKELAFDIMSKYLSDFTEKELLKCIDNAYDDKFDTSSIAPLVERGGAYFLELYHGPTLAFKDMALTILPYLLKTSAKKLK